MNNSQGHLITQDNTLIIDVQVSDRTNNNASRITCSDCYTRQKIIAHNHDIHDNHFFQSQPGHVSAADQYIERSLRLNPIKIFELCFLRDFII